MKVLLLGHSLVEYYDWQARYPAHEMHNLGVAGETAGGLLARIETIAAAHPDADVLLVMTGTNDVLVGDASFPRVFRLLAERLGRTWPAARIVFFSVLPAHPEWVEPAAVKAVNRELRKIVDGTGASFRDLTEDFTDSEGGVLPGLLLDDGVHLSDEGYRVWSGRVGEVLAESSRQP